MEEPKYMNENRYSYSVGYWKPSTTDSYKVEDPETEFERIVQALYINGQTYLQQEKYVQALDTFRELMLLILHTANPQMPVDPNQVSWVAFPKDMALVDTLTAKAAEILQKTPVPVYKFPLAFMSEQSILPGPIEEELKPALENGLQIISHHKIVKQQLETASTAMVEDNFKGALNHYSVALEKTPEDDLILRASLLHDMAIIAEKADDRNHAQELAQRSVKMFEAIKLPEAQIQALDSLTGIFRRAGKEDLASPHAKKAIELRRRNNINPLISNNIATMSAKIAVHPIQPVAVEVTRPGRFERYMPDTTRPTPMVTSLQATPESTIDAPTLMAMKYVPHSDIVKALTIHGSGTTETIKLDANSVANVKNFLQTIRDTDDLRLVTDFWHTPIQMVAYLPHMYFFIIPMAIGDCLAGMGEFKQAEESYLSVLPYPYINKSYEIVKLWTRIARNYLIMGDNAYRQAKDDVNAFSPARSAYENIVLLNRTLNPVSPLYQDSKFASIKTRITNFLSAPDPIAHDDNPALTWIVLGALNKVHQIQAGLNFFGLPPDSPPPFSFEYMQNTARYFAKQASEIEQRYIQYLDQAENEVFRLKQLNQQVDIAEKSEELEKRGVAEAQAGIDVAQTGFNSATLHVLEALNSKVLFDSKKEEILAVEQANAWHSAGEQSGEQTHEALKQDAFNRTKISNELQGDKLQTAINDAVSSQTVAQTQLEMNTKLKAIADQRFEIAKVQNQYAKENRDWLNTRAFSFLFWYELAWNARYLKELYLDRATEIALLMERAYNAETGRKLQVIRTDYHTSTFFKATSAIELMGADQLLADIDYFTYDHVTMVKTKKMPVKHIISFAESYPFTFQQLKTTGRCFFHTDLADFDRKHPGMYLCMLRNVELVFVGLTNADLPAGALRNLGISRFRLENGEIVKRMYPPDVMALSQYDIRQDALAYRFNPNDLRLFENNGIDGLWQLDLPLNANSFDYEDFLDIQLVLYYDGFFSPSLEKTILAMLPTSSTAGRGFSMRMSYFDELYYMKNKGECELTFDVSMFPHNQKNLKRTMVKMNTLGTPETISDLTFRLKSANHGSEIVLKTNDKGEVNSQQFNGLLSEPMFDQWNLHVTAADNPALVSNGIVNLSGLKDVQIFFEFSFDYR